MILIIAGQDISELSLALCHSEEELSDDEESHRLVFITTVSTSPEGYLATINSKLNEWEVSLDDLEGIVIVTGPGSFTASRVSTTIANGLSFAKDIPLYTFENPRSAPPFSPLRQGFVGQAGGYRFSLKEIVDKIDWSKPLDKNLFAVPVYDRPAQITKPKEQKN
ncbi:MAG: hypothetical protein ABIH21_05875 [Patescibacteria group bacterium]